MADTMKALVIEENGAASIREVPMPGIREYEALVKVHASSLCGTDMKIIHNSLKGFADYPTILGHEGVGEVVEVGAKVRNFKVGDKVVLPYILEKLDGYYSTWGALCEYSTVGDADAMVEDGLDMDEKTLYEFNFAQRKIPAELDSVAATMIVTFREVFSTIRRLGFSAGSEIVIYGAGPVGLTFIKLCKHIGMDPVISVDIDDDKNSQALAAGADYVFNSKQVDVAAKLREMYPEGVGILLDAAGVQALINNNLKLVRNFGQVCVYGVTPKNELLMNWQEAPYNFDLRFVQWPSKKEEAEVHDEIIELMKAGVLDGMDYISDVFDFSDALAAIDMFTQGKNKKKIAIKF